MESAYAFIEYEKDFHLIAQACLKIAIAYLEKEKVITAFVGSSILPYMESLQDCGFVLQNEKDSFFGLGECSSVFKLYKHMDQFVAEKFDLVLMAEKNDKIKNELKKKLIQERVFFLDIGEITSFYRSSLQSISATNFFSRLNIYKLAAVCLCTYLCPSSRKIAEIGCYQCGTTLFMAKMLEHMQKKCEIFAFDTFSGIPAASQKDKEGNFCFDQGMFFDVDIQAVKKRLNEEKVLDRIMLCPGLIQETLPFYFTQEMDLFFAFIDTDQYIGTKAGLENVLKSLKSEDFLILVGDASVGGVNTAIEEFIMGHCELKRKKIFTNFDLIFSKKLKLNRVYG